MVVVSTATTNDHSGGGYTNNDDDIDVVAPQSLLEQEDASMDITTDELDPESVFGHVLQRVLLNDSRTGVNFIKKEAIATTPSLSLLSSSSLFVACHICQDSFQLPALPTVHNVMPNNAILNYFSFTKSNTHHKQPATAATTATVTAMTIDERNDNNNNNNNNNSNNNNNTNINDAMKNNPACCSCCDRPSCTNCRRECQNCQKSFCSFCASATTQKSQKEGGDGTFCLDCYDGRR